MTLIVGSTAFNPFGCSIHCGSKKKFCMSTTTNAEDWGSIITDVPVGPSVVGIVIFLSDPPEISYVLVVVE